MKIKTSITIVCSALFFLSLPHIVPAQENGDPQAVIFDPSNRATLKFSDKGEKLPYCGFYLSQTQMDNQEEALAVSVDHMHRRVQIWGGTSFPERGWLYITPSRVVFTVDEGDKSHAFDIPRTDLEEKPGTRFRNSWAGIQINLKEKLAASGSREQKFVFLVMNNRKCELRDPSRFNKFVERAVNDFPAAMAEFKRIATALKEAGKTQQRAAFLPPGAGAISSQDRGQAEAVYAAMLSSIMLDMGRPEAAKEKAKEALQLLASQKEDFKVYWATAEANYVLSNYDAAIANASKAIQLNSEHVGVLLCRGKSHFSKKDYNLALADFDKVIQLQPTLRGAHFQRGLTHYDKEDYDRAIADFDKDIELNPKAITSYILRGSSYSYKGDDTRALAEYSEAIRLQPDYIPAYKIRAKVYERIGDKVKAQADLDKAAELEKQTAKP